MPIGLSSSAASDGPRPRQWCWHGPSSSRPRVDGRVHQCAAPGVWNSGRLAEASTYLDRMGFSRIRMLTIAFPMQRLGNLELERSDSSKSLLLRHGLHSTMFVSIGRVPDMLWLRVRDPAPASGTQIGRGSFWPTREPRREILAVKSQSQFSAGEGLGAT